MQNPRRLRISPRVCTHRFSGSWSGAVARLCVRIPRHDRWARLTKAFLQIKEQRLRRCIVELVEEIAGDELR
jgi:hypothetical protein